MPSPAPLCTSAHGPLPSCAARMPAHLTPLRRLHEPIDNQSVKWDAWASLEVLKEVVSALIFLHEHKILHGDLKAANVLLASSNEDRRRWIAKVRAVAGICSGCLLSVGCLAARVRAQVVRARAESERGQARHPCPRALRALALSAC